MSRKTTVRRVEPTTAPIRQARFVPLAGIERALAEVRARFALPCTPQTGAIRS